MNTRTRTRAMPHIKHPGAEARAHAQTERHLGGLDVSQMTPEQARHLAHLQALHTPTPVQENNPPVRVDEQVFSSMV